MKMICTRCCVLKGRGPCDPGDVVDVDESRADELFIRDHFRAQATGSPPERAAIRQDPPAEHRVKAAGRRSVSASDLPFMKEG